MRAGRAAGDAANWSYYHRRAQPCPGFFPAGHYSIDGSLKSCKKTAELITYLGKGVVEKWTKVNGVGEAISGAIGL